jgi:beta-N-acetylhexosaminidase
VAGLFAILVLALGIHGAAPPAAAPAAPRHPPAARASSARRAGARRTNAHLAAVPSSTAKLLGQRIMVGMAGTSPGAALLRSVREGRVGAVILFAANIGSRAQLRSLTGALQGAARAGGNPPVLIAVDQEGGQVKRLPNGPPDLSPPQMVAAGGPGLAGHEGRATGQYLKGVGINWDLAPVSDVPTFAGAFVWQQGRAFSFNSRTVASYATQFALGLQTERVAATAKHFPGVGTAAVDTDNRLDELHPTSRQLSAALDPYRAMIPRGLDAVMLSTAGFPAYDRTGTLTAFSRAIVQRLLRGRLGFRGVTITDSLSGTPIGHDPVSAGVLAARAGADVLLYTDGATGVLQALQSALAAGRLNRAEVVASYARIVALKRRVG